MDSNNTNLITVRANPAVEVSVQNSEVTAHDSNNATSQLHNLLATVMAAFQVESTKQTAAFQTEVAKLIETLKAQFKQ
jgi:hypothetical protein